MGEALAAGYDLAALLACFIAIGALLLVVALVDALVSVLNVGIGPWHPFSSIANALHNKVVRVLNSAIRDLEGATAKFESGLVEAITLIIGIPLLIAVGLYDLMAYIWHTALSAFIHVITGPIATTASSALTQVKSLAGDVADNLTAAKAYAVARANAALSDAQDFASHWIDNAVSVLNAHIAAALATAMTYADTAVSKLRAAEDAAVAGAVGLAVEAKNAGVNAAAAALRSAEDFASAEGAKAIAAAAGALTTAEGYADVVGAKAIAAAAGALMTAEGYADVVAAHASAEAAGAIAELDAAGKAALETVRSVAVGVADDLHTIEGAAGLLGAEGLIAAIPAIATLTHAIATEAGLENADCRNKVKDICRTDTSAWGELLGGLAAIGFAFSLLELAEAADPLLVKLAPIIVEAA